MTRVLIRLVATEVVFLIFHSDSHTVRLLMAVGIALGFLSQLCPGRDLRRPVERFHTETQLACWKCVKFIEKRFNANAFTWLTLAGLTWYSLGDSGIVDESPLTAA